VLFGDDVVIDETFGGTSASVSHDHAGNLIDDGKLVYVYDAPALDSWLRQREQAVRQESRR